MPKLKISMYQLDRLIKRYSPTLFRVFTKTELSAELFSIQWFITLFSYDLPFDELKVVWDLFLLEGWSFIFKFSLAILFNLPPVSINIDSERLIFLIKDVLQNHSIMKLVNKAVKIAVTDEDLNLLESEYVTLNASFDDSKELSGRTKAEFSSNRGRNSSKDINEGTAEVVYKFKVESHDIENFKTIKKHKKNTKEAQYIVPKVLVNFEEDIIVDNPNSTMKMYKTKIMKTETNDNCTNNSRITQKMKKLVDRNAKNSIKQLDLKKINTTEEGISRNNLYSATKQ